MNPSECVSELRLLLDQLCSERQEFDFLPPSWQSRVAELRDDLPRLQIYARQVVSARIMMMIAFSRMNTKKLLATYLYGVDSKNPFPMLLAARSQMELFSVVWDTKRVVLENSGEQSEQYQERVQAVDDALINATFGTRSEVAIGLAKKLGLVKKSETRVGSDPMSARSVLTRLERLSKSGEYPTCKLDYERLCEYVHPNVGMNLLLVVKSPVNSKLLRYSQIDDDPSVRAMAASAGVMARCARGVTSLLDEIHPPFGEGHLTRTFH